MNDLSHTKFTELVEIEGHDDPIELLADATADRVCPAICMSDCCCCTAGVETDQDRGWCEECGMNPMESVLRLAGII